MPAALRVLTLLGLFAAIGNAAASVADPSAGSESGAVLARIAPSPLLAIDQNRSTVIDRIVGEWGDALVKSSAGIDAEQLRALLTAMRADQLLAASLAGSLEGLRNVIATSLVGESEVKPSLLHAKALGDANQDVVYVPVTPCRLVETRGTFLAVYQTGGAYAPAEVRTYKVEGGNGACLSQLPASLNPTAVQMQVFALPTTGGSGDVEMLPQGAAFGSTATMVFLGNIPVTTVSTTTLLNLANKQISVQVRGGGLHLAIDVVGYFRAPAGGFVSSVTAGAGLTGGTITSSGTIAVDTATIQSRVTGTCAAGSSIRTINANGTVVCEADDVGGAGTVTSVGTGTGLTGGPITGIGTVNLATTQLLPAVACANGQTPAWNGSAWVCSDPFTFGGNINLADSTSASVGNITKGATRFIHNYGSNNTFVGKIAGNFAMTGAGNSAIGNGALSGNQGGVENTASGLNALTSNTIGNQNTANGSQALYSNTIGSYNTATGNYALLSNVTGFENTASGHSALQLNATGFHNTAIGSNALHSNTSASYNTASGAYALSSNTTGSENTAIGSQALYLNTTGLLNTASGRKALGANTSGIYDTASGSYALSANTDGSYNTASGTAALYSNTSGNYNTASGTQALYSNQNGSYNSVSGNDAMYSNTSGSYNTASGSYALYSNTTGFENTASGSNALFSNTTGRRNAASGNSALYLNTTGSDNTAIGYSALFDVTTENGNTAVGSGARVSGNNATAIGFQALALGDNATAIGFQAHAIASNYVWLGNASVTLIGGQVAWSNPSDLRDKKDIADSSLGLDFVKALRPVEFKLLNGNDRVDFGFIAQEVEALIGTGYNMLGSGGTAERKLSLRYTDFIAPMVKAIQQQHAMIASQQAQIDELRRAVEILMTGMQSDAKVAAVR